MSYQSIVNAIRTAAESVNPDGEFIHGRRVDASQFSIDARFPVIALYPFQIADPDANSDVDQSTIIMGFWDQDSAESSVSEREQLIAGMDELVSEWKEEMKLNNDMRMLVFTREPQYQFYNGTVSGMAIRFTLQVMSDTVC